MLLDNRLLLSHRDEGEQQVASGVFGSSKAEGTIDLPAVKQWLQTKGGLKALELTDQAFATASGPIADSVAAAKQVSTCT